MNITIDDTSPLIQYNSKTNGWATNHTGDGDTPDYFLGTFHSTFGDGDSMSFSFNGSAIYVYGAYRANHGLYSTQLDGGNVGYNLGYSANDKLQYPIFFSKGLDVTREHNLVITNLPTQSNPPATATNPLFLDIDYIVVTTAASGKVWTTTYDDFSPAFQYQGFQPSPNFGPEWFNQTVHTTSNNSDAVTFKFNGSSVQIFGGINYNHGNYSVNLDGALTQLYNGSYTTLSQNATVFLATNLTDGPHTVIMKNADAGKLFSVDWAVTNSSVSPVSGSNSTNTTTGSSDTNGGRSGSGSGSSSNTGAIAGGVVGGVVGAVLIGFLIWFFVIRKKRRHGKGKSYDPVDLNGGPNTDPGGPHERLDGREVAPFPTGTTGAYGSTHPHDGGGGSSGLGSANSTGPGQPQMSQAGLSGSATGNAPFLTTIPPPPPSNATSYPRSNAASSPSQYTQHTPHSSFNPYESLAIAGAGAAGARTGTGSSGPTENGTNTNSNSNPNSNSAGSTDHSHYPNPHPISASPMPQNESLGTTASAPPPPVGSKLARDSLAYPSALVANTTNTNSNDNNTTTHPELSHSPDALGPELISPGGRTSEDGLGDAPPPPSYQQATEPVPAPTSQTATYR